MPNHRIRRNSRVKIAVVGPRELTFNRAASAALISTDIYELIPFFFSYIHHVALRVTDADACKEWLAARLGFRAKSEFEFGGMQFVWMSPEGADSPVIEVIGGGSVDKHPEGQSTVSRGGFNHVCLHVRNVDEVMAKLKQQNVTVIMEMPVGPPGSGVKCASFVSDPWGNVFEFVKLEG